MDPTITSEVIMTSYGLHYSVALMTLVYGSWMYSYTVILTDKMYNYTYSNNTYIYVMYIS